MPATPTVAELRVHGVGGCTGARILGLDNDHAPELVAQGGRTQFWKRPDDEHHIEGYVWGGLTTDSKLQPLWLLLLPFTLLNVAGFTHKPYRTIGRWRIRATHICTFLVGLTLTGTYVTWLTAIGVDQVGHRWLAAKYDTISPLQGVVIGAVGVALLMTLCVVLAIRTRGGEKYEERGDTRGGRLGLTAEDSLLNEGFFNRARNSNNLLLLHCVAGAAFYAALVAAAYRAGNTTPPPDRVEQYLSNAFFAVGAAQVVAIVLLLLSCFSLTKPGFRWCGPAVVAVLSVAVAHTMFAGASRALDHVLKVKAGGPFLLADVTFYVLMTLVVSALVWTAANRIVPAWLRDAADVPHNTAEPGTPANGATTSMRRKTARFRRLAARLTTADVLLTLTAAAFVVLAVAAMIGRRDDRDWMVWEPASIAGSQILVYGGAAVALVLWQKRNDPKTRKAVGTVWDLLTFWPRRFHPFAVRPYSSQAVPELRNRIRHLVADGRLILSTHSQGTVIGLAAVAPLVDAEGTTEQISLVTFGSPIGGLYAMAFPAYFNTEVTTVVHHGLRDWRNFKRLTDPIASDIPGVETITLSSPDVDPDPDASPLVPTPPLMERDRIPWLEVATHSDYRNEPLLKRYVSNLRVR